MRALYGSAAALAVAASLAACDDAGTAASPAASGVLRPAPVDTAEVTKDAGVPPSDSGAAYAWNLPPGFPVPRVPDDNPMTAEKVALGRRLFYEKKLSGNGTFSCGSCHEQKRAFTDGRGLAVGATGGVHARSSMSLANAAYASGLTWANPLMTTLEKQALVPMYGREPVELGSPDEAVLLARLGEDAAYADLFARAFPEEPVASLDHIVKAIASFERTLVSGGSPYDRELAGEKGAMSAEAKRGMELFFSERLECYHCHVGFAFSDATVHAGSTFVELPYHNTGLYNVDGSGAYPAPNRGVFEVTSRGADMGRFRAVTLRNIELTAPYFHDGSAATLEDVVDHYAAGGRHIESGAHAGDGSKSPLKNPLVRAFPLTASEKADVVAFLRSLTDATFLTDPRFSDPFEKGLAP